MIRPRDRSFVQLHDSEITIRPKVTGPSYFTFVPAGDHFAGKSLEPIVTKFSGVEDGEKFSVNKT